MIQSSQPSSLKFTCRAFLLHLYLDFFPCRFPCRLFGAVLRRRRGGPWPGPSALAGFSSADRRDLIFSFISLNRMAFSCCPRPLLSRPSRLRSTSSSDLPRAARSWKQSWLLCWRCVWNASHTSRTSQPPVSSWRWKGPATSNRYFCLLRGECKRLSARRKEENNCSQIHLECTVFRERGGVCVCWGGGGGVCVCVLGGGHILPQRPSLSLSLSLRPTCY
uniref:Uncharacterized protein n=1 Tax=Xiphophorus maculatus TaxID=8083 RepID=A0A3B5QZF0_XIPMA